MPSITTQTQLQQLRPGDRLKYHGVQWNVKDCSTYHEPQGYETTEWLLRSQTGKEYYLLREVDPQDEESGVNWYLAEEVRFPHIYQPGSQYDLFVDLWSDMQGQNTPYPELQVFNRVYYFESQTQGYEDNDRKTRITWDYWDAAHQWNLAIEAWIDGSLAVYSTKLVKPEEFCEMITGFSQEYNQVSFSSRAWQFLGAWCLVIVGILMMIFG